MKKWKYILFAIMIALILIIVWCCYEIVFSHKSKFAMLEIKTDISVEQVDYGYSEFTDGNYYISSERNVYTIQDDRLIPLYEENDCRKITSTKYLTIVLDYDNVAKIYASGLRNRLYFKEEVGRVIDIDASPYYFAIINDKGEVRVSKNITNSDTMYECGTYEEAIDSDIDLQKINNISPVVKMAVSNSSILLLCDNSEIYVYGCSSQIRADEEPIKLDIPDEIKITDIFGNESGYYIRDSLDNYYAVFTSLYNNRQNHNKLELLESLSGSSDYLAFYNHSVSVKNGDVYIGGYLFCNGEHLFNNELVEKKSNNGKIFVTKDGWGEVSNSLIRIRYLSNL